jgi:hypothetical protein
MNYGQLSGACATLPARIINTEYHEGWVYWCYRGDNTNGSGQMADDLSAGGYAYQRWNLWTGLLAGNYSPNKIAGGTMWSFNDYWSDHSGGVNPMGAVDHMRIPKAVYYLFRKFWTGVSDTGAGGVPVAGITPTSLQLNADTAKLVADSCDVTIITASLRSSSGLCVDNTDGGKNTDTIPVTFSVSGPADAFGANPYKLFAGKCAIMIKSTNTPGTITVSATGDGFTAAPIYIQSLPADTTSLPFLGTPVLRHGAMASAPQKISIRQLQYSVMVSFTNQNARGWKVRMVNFNGDVISCPVSAVPGGFTIGTRGLATGFYLLSVTNRAAAGVTKKIFIAR